VRGPCGGGVHGGPFHSQNVESFFLNTPGLKMVEPSNPYDAKGLIKAAIRDDDPVLFFEHKLLYRNPNIKQEVPAEDYIVPIGKAATRREGTDISIITYGAMVYKALEAAGQLEQEGIDVEVIDLRTLAPLDREAIVETVKKTSKVIILHEATRTGGIAGEIAAIINESAFEHLDGPITRVTSIDTPVPYAPPLEEFFLPQVDDVLKAARSLSAY
jgi:2-oxoisovalerate dehydrogenase E1 component beta subunit